MLASAGREGRGSTAAAPAAWGLVLKQVRRAAPPRAPGARMLASGAAARQLLRLSAHFAGRERDGGHLARGAGGRRMSWRRWRLNQQPRAHVWPVHAASPASGHRRQCSNEPAGRPRLPDPKFRRPRLPPAVRRSRPCGAFLSIYSRQGACHRPSRRPRPGANRGNGDAAQPADFSRPAAGLLGAAAGLRGAPSATR